MMENIILISTFRVLGFVLVALSSLAIIVWLERRVSAFMQDRSGPNRCNINNIRLGGLVQSVADIVKLFTKEDFIPNHIENKKYFFFAPAILFVCVVLSLGTIPFADSIIVDTKEFVMQPLHIDIGILWFLAFAGLSVYGIIIAGWSSDNKYSILGAIRAASQTISYEIAMGLAIISFVLTYSSVNLNDMVSYQSDFLWGVFIQPIATMIFIITAFAETNRTPFDLAEGESELVGGYHTEYGGIKFTLFFAGEYVALFISSALIVTLCFGGYNLPFATTDILRSNSTTLLSLLAICMPIVVFVFSKWILKNNTSKSISLKETRYKEAMKLISIIVFISAIIEAMMLYHLYIGVSDFASMMITLIFQIVVFLVKTFMMVFVFIWVRWTLPRFRFDQLQKLGWTRLLPLALANLFITTILVVL